MIHKTINEQKKILYYIHLYSVMLYYIILYQKYSKHINKSWESFGWHVRASMDAHFPIALLCLYTLNVAGSPSYWKSQQKTPLKQFTWQTCRNVNGDIYKIDAADCKHCRHSRTCLQVGNLGGALLPLRSKISCATAGAAMDCTAAGRRVYKFQTIEIDRQRANGGTNWTEFA